LVVAVVVGGDKLGVEADELSGRPVRVCVLNVVALLGGDNETGSVVLEGKETGIGGLERDVADVETALGAGPLELDSVVVVIWTLDEAPRLSNVAV
jgi:hypothetical protein